MYTAHTTIVWSHRWKKEFIETMDWHDEESRAIVHCITFLAPKIYFKVPSPLLEHLDFIVLLKVGYQMKSRIKKCPNHKNLFLFFSCKPKFQETSHLVPKNMEETSMEASHILITANADEGWRRGEPKDDEGNPQNWLT